MRHSGENTSSEQELPDSLQPTPKPSGTVDMEKNEKDTIGSSTATSRRNALFIKKELPEWLRTPPKQTQHVEEKIEEDEELFCEELRIPKRTNLTANGKPSRRTLSAAEVIENAQRLKEFEPKDIVKAFPKSTDHAIESTSAVDPEAENLIRKLYERSWSSEEEDLINRCLDRKPKKKKTARKQQLKTYCH